MLSSYAYAGIKDVGKKLIPNRVGINYLATMNNYGIPALSAESCHIQRIPIKEGYTEYCFTLPKLILDAEGEIGIGSTIGIGLYNFEFQLGFYSIIGAKQHETNKGYRTFIGIELF